MDVKNITFQVLLLCIGGRGRGCRKTTSPAQSGDCVFRVKPVGGFSQKIEWGCGDASQDPYPLCVFKTNVSNFPALYMT